MKRAVLSREAREDLDDIKAYLRGRAGARIADRVIAELLHGIRSIAAEPGIGHTRKDVTPRPLKFWPVG